MSHRLVVFCLLLQLFCSSFFAQAEPVVVRSDSLARLPGAEEFSQDLARRILDRRVELLQSGLPRSRYKAPTGEPKYLNRLALESSPYLLQHAFTPVNWYPWGEEAFQVASKLNRPVLLSIGYSTCHWCHVMEEESFDNEEIAKYLNENYVSIKVDREELPHVDAVYLKAVQAMTGQSGWPLNVWLMADRSPFYGGTYFPPIDNSTLRTVGFLTVLARLREAFLNNKSQLENVGKEITNAFNSSPGATEKILDQKVISLAVEQIGAAYDEQNGGIKNSPKFPSDFPVGLMLRAGLRMNDSRVTRQALTTLKKMSIGAIFDHIAGGFHRYSVDETWSAPHFEKMLYDNALLLQSYLEGYQVGGDLDLEFTSRRILGYLEEMKGSDGGFFTASDADSLDSYGKLREGAFYVWEDSEVLQSLYPIGDSRENLKSAFDTNFGLLKTDAGRVIVAKSLTELSERLKVPAAELKQERVRLLDKLKLKRANRPAPFVDKKIITSWNALAVSALAKSGFVFSEARYLDLARGAMNFLLSRMVSGDRVFRIYSEGSPKIAGGSDDYVFLVTALLDLFESTGEINWLEKAIATAKLTEARFWDSQNGGYFQTEARGESAFFQQKIVEDGVMPSANSMALLNLLRLSEITGDGLYRERALQLIKVFAGEVLANPPQHAFFLKAVDFLTDSVKQIVIVNAEKDLAGKNKLISELARSFVPSRVVIIVDEKDVERVSGLVPLVKGKEAIDGKTTAYVCLNRSCKLPTNDPAEFRNQITSVKSYS